MIAFVIAGLLIGSARALPCSQAGEMCSVSFGTTVVPTCDGCPAGTSCKVWPTSSGSPTESYCQLDECIAEGNICANRIGTCCAGSTCDYNPNTGAVACSVAPTTVAATTAAPTTVAATTAAPTTVAATTAAPTTVAATTAAPTTVAATTAAPTTVAATTAAPTTVAATTAAPTTVAATTAAPTTVAATTAAPTTVAATTAAPTTVTIDIQTVPATTAAATTVAATTAAPTTAAPTTAAPTTAAWCVTVSGNQAGSTCVFPFTYHGHVHTECTLDGGFARPWCSTQVDSNGNHVVGAWGDCPASCPTETVATTPEPTCTTTSGAKCVFPFIYNGHVHRECTRDGGFSTPWCSTKTDAWGFHVKGNYGDCTSTCHVEPTFGDIFGFLG